MISPSTSDVSITYGVQFTTLDDEVVVVTCGENSAKFGSASDAVRHAIHLRSSGFSDAHPVHELSGRFGWQAMHHHTTPPLTSMQSPTEMIAAVLTDHTCAGLNPADADCIANFAIQAAGLLTASNGAAGNQQ